MNDAPILAIETSVETGSVALWTGGEVVRERSFPAGRKPSASLWDPLEEVMAEVQALSAVVVGIGPGSYNGSRVGIAAAQGIALVHQCSVAPICSFEGVPMETARALAIGDARRGNFSRQSLQTGRVEGDFALGNLEELADAIADSRNRGEEVFSFDRAERFPLAEELQALIQYRQSEAGRLAAAFAKRNPAERDTLLATLAEPFYLRDPHITIGKRKSLLDRA
ncbi:tRNA (adenosine(37)-N6)-threonylcarbamoyltransferase complex dimerization subunit type 1 TsaB [Roseibacillus persicicus]|uniref:tRNA (adenosine(37)-N6)-threonylcarbamoyltransferase complex dimerization subunit type 1 TsaB n=1 Tax=Roseibacillus persicicus TaxID=454148 RepID=UPI00398AB869